LALGFFFENDLGENRAGNVIAGTRVLDFKLGAFLDHRGKVIERHIRRSLGVVETPIGVLFDDHRTFGFGFIV
jgi:hypothetical protein